MIKRNLFNKTINILVEGYMSGNLRKNQTCECVIGNLTGGGFFWSTIFHTTNGRKIFLLDLNAPFCDSIRSLEMPEGGRLYLSTEKLKRQALEEINKTGYTLEQLIEIEHAFETNSEDDSPGEQFKGLMSVVDVLCDIHRTGLGEKANSQKKFIPLAVLEAV